MKNSLIIILLIFFAACNSNRNSRNSTGNQGEQDTASVTRVFVPEKLQDTLMLFLTTIDSIPNPYNAPTKYLIMCERKNNDTIIVLTAHIGLPRLVIIDGNAPKDSLLFHIKGGCEVNDKEVIVFYDGFRSLENIIHEEVLTLQFVEDHDFFKTYKGEREALNLSPFSKWQYKLVNGDSLELLHKQKGRFEKKEEYIPSSLDVW